MVHLACHHLHVGGHLGQWLAYGVCHSLERCCASNALTFALADGVYCASINCRRPPHPSSAASVDYHCVLFGVGALFDPCKALPHLIEHVVLLGLFLPALWSCGRSVWQKASVLAGSIVVRGVLAGGRVREIRYCTRRLARSDGNGTCCNHTCRGTSIFPQKYTLATDLTPNSSSLGSSHRRFLLAVRARLHSPALPRAPRSVASSVGLSPHHWCSTQRRPGARHSTLCPH